MKSKRSMKSVSKDLQEAFAGRFGPKDLEKFIGLVSEFHAIDAPEDEKRDQKDKDFVNLVVNNFVRAVLRDFIQGNITVTERRLFLMIAGLFMKIEGILWELKGHSAKDPIPEPDPLPPDPDEPDDEQRRRI